MWHCNSVVEDPQWQEEDSNWVLLRDSPSHRLSSVRRTQIDSQNRHQDSCRHGVNYQRDTWFGHIDSRRSWLSYLRRPLLKRAVIPLMLPRHRADGDVLSKGGRTWRTMASCKEVYLDWLGRGLWQRNLFDTKWKILVHLVVCKPHVSMQLRAALSNHTLSPFLFVDLNFQIWASKIFKHKIKVIIGIVFPNSVFVMAKLLARIKEFSKIFFEKKNLWLHNYTTLR